LHAAGQTWWQVLPVGPTGAGDSPYSGVSTHAGNPLLLDLSALERDGLLTPQELAEADLPAGRVDYAAVAAAKDAALRRAFARGWGREAAAAAEFARTHAWAEDYALFMAARRHFGGLPWLEWPDEGLRRRDPAALERWRTSLAEEVRYHLFVQLLFDGQWQALRDYVRSRGVRLLGDLPIYVSLDSADVWASPRDFQLDETGHPTEVAGVPPDYFSAQGQLWGNPLYDWDAMRRDGFGWWIRRVDSAARRFDAVRIDHFRGLESYWAVPADAATAQIGRWRKGPGMELLGVLTSWFSGLTYVAEDLGLLTPAVGELRRAAGMPGMKVLEFAFSGPDNAYLPHNCVPGCVLYTGTHDNDTAVGWYAHADAAQRAFAARYLGVTGAEETRLALLRAGQGSVAELFIAQMQDYLGLGSEARINVPGVAGGNWCWRLEADALEKRLTPALAAQVRELTVTYGRCAPAPEDKTFT
jgi:4-alpha-glucanotransferase